MWLMNGANCSDLSLASLEALCAFRLWSENASNSSKSNYSSCEMKAEAKPCMAGINFFLIWQKLSDDYYQ